MKIKLVIFLVILLSAPQSQAETVCKVHDGDTFKLCNGQSIRIWGIDAPELKQPFGKEARNYLTALTRNRDVSLECKGKHWKRKVCKVRAGGLDIQREMIGWGLAFDSVQYSKGAYKASERFAREQGRGVWIIPNGGTRPWDFRQ